VIGMGLLLGLLLIASWTDIRAGKIYNWSTYPGMLLGLCGGAAVTWLAGAAEVGARGHWEWTGLIPFEDAIGGFLLCGLTMLCCYVFFAGQIGGGDIKLIAMIGALMGAMDGLEVMLWAFVLAAVVALIRIVWKVGFANVITNGCAYLISVIRNRAVIPITREERTPMQTSLCLAPSVLAAVIVVRWEWIATWISREV